MTDPNSIQQHHLPNALWMEKHTHARVSNADGQPGGDCGVGQSPATLKSRRTPPHVERLLRECNSRGVTRWNDILECLKNETPPILIKRSTLGEYLKECQIGTSRRKTMNDSELKQIVVDELTQYTGRKRGVRKVWETLKSKGHHIKRDFVEKVMKEIDPGGFLERRPKWGVPTTVDNPTADDSSLTSDPLPWISSRSSLPASQNTFLLLPDNLPTSFMQSLTQDDRIHTGNFDQSAGNAPVYSVSRELARDTRYPDIRSSMNPEEVSASLENGDANSCIGDSVSAINLMPEDYSENLGFGVEPIRARAKIVDSETQADIFQWGDSGNKTNLEARRTRRKLFEAVATGDQDEQRTHIRHLQMQNTVSDICVRLDEWCIAPLQGEVLHPNTPTLGGLPLSVAEVTTAQPEVGDTLLHLPYVPDYTVSEEEETNGALVAALTLQHLLSLPKSSERVIEVTSQLRGLRGRLQNIGMPKAYLIKIGLKHLNVLETVSCLRGRSGWVLEDMWICAADCLVGYYGPRRRDLARQAADIAQDLISINPHHSDFYRAANLHYRALYLFEDDCDDDEAFDLIGESVALFRKSVTNASSYHHVLEMMRALSIEDAWLYHDEEALLVLDHVLAHACTSSSSSTLAPALCTFSQTMFYIMEHAYYTHSAPFIQKAQSLVEVAVTHLQIFRATRPSVVEPALTYAIHAQAIGLGIAGRHSNDPEELEDLLTLPRRLATFGDADAFVNRFAIPMNKSIHVQLHSHQWESAVDTANDLVGFIRSAPYRIFAVRWELGNCLRHFLDHLEATQNAHLAAAVQRLFNPFRSILIANHDIYMWIFFKLSDVLVMASDILREQGAFKDSLRLSRDAVTITTDFPRIPAWYGGHPAAIRACHARSLIDNDEYEEAISHLHEAESTLYDLINFSKPWSNINDRIRERADTLALFGVAHALHPVKRRTIHGIIQTLGKWGSGNRPPYWLRHPRYHPARAIDAHAWLLLIETVMTYTSPAEALVSGKESLSLFSKYYESSGAHLEPQTRASVLGHKFILLHILGQEDEAQIVLSQSVDLYRSVLASEPHLAWLPLLIFLELLLVLSRDLTNINSARPKLQGWKRSVYGGSTSFFEEFVLHLKNLPSQIPALSEFPGSETTISYSGETSGWQVSIPGDDI